MRGTYAKSTGAYECEECTEVNRRVTSGALAIASVAFMAFVLWKIRKLTQTKVVKRFALRYWDTGKFKARRLLKKLSTLLSS